MVHKVDAEQTLQRWSEVNMKDNKNNGGKQKINNDICLKVKYLNIS